MHISSRSVNKHGHHMQFFFLIDRFIKNLIYICNQYPSPLRLWVRIPFRQGVLDTTLWDKVCKWLAEGQWLSPLSSTNKTDRHDITEIFLFYFIYFFCKFSFFLQIHHITCAKQDKHIISVNDSYCYLCAQHINTFFLKSVVIVITTLFSPNHYLFINI